MHAHMYVARELNNYIQLIKRVTMKTRAHVPSFLEILQKNKADEIFIPESEVEARNGEGSLFESF